MTAQDADVRRDARPPTGREWVVLPDSDERPARSAASGRHRRRHRRRVPGLERRRPATFPPPDVDDLGDAASTDLLRTALRVGFSASAGPFRSLAGIAVEPRAYQYVPLLLALRQDTVRLLIADDVGIGKTIEAGLIAAELLAQGDARRLAVLCSPALAEQWQRELRDKFGIDAELVLPSTATRLTRGLMLNESLFDRYPHVVVSTDFIKSPTGAGTSSSTTAPSSSSSTRPTARSPTAPAVAAGPHPALRPPEGGRRGHNPSPHPGHRHAALRQGGGLPQPARPARPRPRHRRPRRRQGPRAARPPLRPAPPRRHPPLPRRGHGLPVRPRDPRSVPTSLSPDYAALFDDVLDYAREQVVDTTGPAGRRASGSAGGPPWHCCAPSRPRPAPRRRRCAPAPPPKRPPSKRPTPSAAPPCSTPPTTRPSSRRRPAATRRIGDDDDPRPGGPELP